MKKVLLVSAAISSRLQESLFREHGLSAGFAIQKYYHLLEEGLSLNDVEVEALSIVPIPEAEAPFLFKSFASEAENGVYYRYFPYFKKAKIYHPLLVIIIFFRVLLWCFMNRRDSIVLCDILIPSVCLGAAWGAGISGRKRIAWVTDMPGVSTDGNKSLERMGFVERLQINAIKSFSAFVCSTKQANDKLNVHDKPYAIIEGFVSADTVLPDDLEGPSEKVIMYAGSLKEEYGLGFLCEAFSRLKDKTDWRLVIYGAGPYETALRDYSAKDPRIEIRGAAPNDTIVKEEESASLLVNPRFTGAEYTLYSYPSKNIEYMSSGTPVASTWLAGTPDDYHSYIYTFDDESVDGYAATLDSIMSKPQEELRAFGRRAASFIISTRSSEAQARKILNLV